jgi:hypothetical protein
MKNSGQERIRTSEVERQRIYSPPHLAALEPAQLPYVKCSFHYAHDDPGDDLLYSEPLVGIEPTTC